ncbi:MAG: sugar porter family MFS transporter [Chlamydiae bacterium]|nr:sugar porter family MFS transporter [Chlamydiota bacterium]
MIYLIAAIASLTGLLFGFDEGIIAGVLDNITTDFQLHHYEIGFMMGLLPLAALFSAFFTGKLADRIGRLHVLYFISILFAIGTLGIVLFHSFVILCIARFLLGLTIGMSVVIAPLYIAETAPEKIRGKLVICFQLAITIGILSSYAISALLTGLISWHWMFATGLLPASALFIGSLFLPESPRWLLMKGRNKEARIVLYQLYGKKSHPEKIEKELNQIQDALSHTTTQGVFKELFSKRGMPCLLIGVSLFFFQQMSGINVVIYFAPKIFQAMHMGARSATLLATVGVGLVNTLMTCVSFSLIERIGRRSLLLFGFFGAACSLGMIGIFTLMDGSIFQYLATIAIFLYISAFAIGLGPVPFVLASEIFPLKIRGQGMSFAATSNWTFNTLVVSSFPSLLVSIGVSYIFLFYSAICVLGLLYTLRFIPETKGLSLEQIEEYVQSGKPLNTLR